MSAQDPVSLSGAGEFILLLFIDTSSGWYSVCGIGAETVQNA
jgi:hypothetical protein